MSGGLIGNAIAALRARDGAAGAASTRRRCASCTQSGVGMLEFLVALLIFSVGMIGLMSAQLAGKKASFDASQRSNATALVRDIVERMRANPGQAMAYQVVGAGDEGSRLPPPDADCGVTDCGAEQLAAFDLWQWESLLVGESARDAAGNAGGLVAPRACIRSADGAVDVVVSWQGVTRAVMSAQPAAPTVCDIGIEDIPLEETDEASLRHRLTVSTFIARR
jgi:type IV pilus assembly protein PilV